MMVKNELLQWQQQVDLIYGNQVKRSRGVQRIGLDLATKDGASLPEMIAGTTLASTQFEYVFKNKVISLGARLTIPITGCHLGEWQIPRGFVEINDDYWDEGLIDELYRYANENKRWAIKALYYKWYINSDWGVLVQGYMPYVIWGDCNY